MHKHSHVVYIVLYVRSRLRVKDEKKCSEDKQWMLENEQEHRTESSATAIENEVDQSENIDSYE